MDDIIIDQKETISVVRAAMYARMSTDHQKYSIELQAHAINEYAQKMGFSVVESYADEGKSGLTIHKRDELKRLILDVQSGRANFSVILVLDVSRWGRFQDIDESAYYEYICKKAGIAVHYVAEQFTNDNTPLSAILKAIKRTMAGEYSRELSAKVFKARIRLGEKGFRQGGAAGYGLRRAVIDDTGKLKKVLRHDERKSFPSDRIILVPGPKKEIQLVNWIYKQFADHGYGEQAIANILNNREDTKKRDGLWSRDNIRGMLTNEKYIGNCVLNKKSQKLGSAPVPNPEYTWVRANGVYKPIVPIDLFNRVQAKKVLRKKELTDDEMLDRLRELAARTPELTAKIIDDEPHFPSASRYIERFGSIVNAYKLIGYKPHRSYYHSQIKNHLDGLKKKIETLIAIKLEELGKPVSFARLPFSLLQIEDKKLSLVMCSRINKQTKKGLPIWQGCVDKRRQLTHLVVIVRMDYENINPKSYYLIPSSKIKTKDISFPRTKNIDTEAYLCGSLDDLISRLALSIS